MNGVHKFKKQFGSLFNLLFLICATFQVPDKSHASTTDNKSSSFVTDLGFIHAFVASISVILVSELGDKTFFIAAIMAMRHPRLVVFAGAMAALGLMTVLSG